ncbi:MAG: transcription initiation factor IIB [Nitrosopumilus sp.]|nr:transcription initiation factor IIB [Nitrosopumilus sp.]
MKEDNLKCNEDVCIYCNNILRINDEEAGEIVCGNCGYVISERKTNSGVETNVFTEDTSKQRTGSGFSLARHDMGLSSVINYSDKDVRGKNLSPVMKSTMKRFRIWEKRSIKSTDKNFQRAFADLDRIKSKLVVSDAVIEKAAYIYRKTVEIQLTKGRSTTAFVIASLYAACRISGTPRTINDVQKASGLSRRNITKYYRLLVTELDLQIPVVDPVQCVTRIANNAGVTEKTKRFAIDILAKAKQHGIMEGKNPTSSAAVALYIACKKMKETLSLRKIATCANITELTIRNGRKRFQIILENS